jgi:hypothetical protein
MTLNFSAWQRRAIFHPLIFGELVRLVVHCIHLKITLRGLFILIGMNFAIKKDDHVVYLKKFEFIF